MLIFSSVCEIFSHRLQNQNSNHIQQINIYKSIISIKSDDNLAAQRLQCVLNVVTSRPIRHCGRQKSNNIYRKDDDHYDHQQQHHHGMSSMSTKGRDVIVFRRHGTELSSGLWLL